MHSARTLTQETHMATIHTLHEEEAIKDHKIPRPVPLGQEDTPTNPWTITETPFSETDHLLKPMPTVVPAVLMVEKLTIVQVNQIDTRNINNKLKTVTKMLKQLSKKFVSLNRIPLHQHVMPFALPRKPKKPDEIVLQD